MIDVPEPLRETALRLHTARQAGDADAIAAVCSEDALLILPNGERRAGRAAIAAYYREGARKLGAGANPNFKFYFYPPMVHALASVNGRHGEKHSLIDIYQQQPDMRYLLVFSTSTMR